MLERGQERPELGPEGKKSKSESVRDVDGVRTSIVIEWTMTQLSKITAIMEYHDYMQWYRG